MPVVALSDGLRKIGYSQIGLISKLFSNLILSLKLSFYKLKRLDPLPLIIAVIPMAIKIKFVIIVLFI